MALTHKSHRNNHSDGLQFDLELAFKNRRALRSEGLSEVWTKIIQQNCGRMLGRQNAELTVPVSLKPRFDELDATV